MKNDLQKMICNYKHEQIINEKLHIVARIDGKALFNGYYSVIATIETNYSRIAIDWPEIGKIPGEFQERYRTESIYPVKFDYFDEEDIIHLSGDYYGKKYLVKIQLPPKKN